MPQSDPQPAQPAVPDSLSDLEVLALAAVLHLGRDAYGVSIREEIKDCPEVDELLQFIDSSDRGVITG